jgi:hypothetical protein
MYLSPQSLSPENHPTTSLQFLDLFSSSRLLSILLTSPRNLKIAASLVATDFSRDNVVRKKNLNREHAML